MLYSFLGYRRTRQPKNERVTAYVGIFFVRAHDDDDNNYNNIKTITIEHQIKKKIIIMIGSYNMLLSSIRVY